MCVFITALCTALWTCRYVCESTAICTCGGSGPLVCAFLQCLGGCWEGKWQWHTSFDPRSRYSWLLGINRKQWPCRSKTSGHAQPSRLLWMRREREHTLMSLKHTGKSKNCNRRQPEPEMDIKKGSFGKASKVMTFWITLYVAWLCLWIKCQAFTYCLWRLIDFPIKPLYVVVCW